MRAQIISIGNELLIGDTVNTNASWMGQFLNELGVDVQRVHTISDDKQIISNTIRQCLQESDLVITTGGLGPTHDDITKTTIAELFGVEMRQDEEVLIYIKELFASRNIPFSASNAWQAMVPENCEVLFNKAGTAPGMWFHEQDCFLAVLPGVPYEMKYLMKRRVASKLREHAKDIGYIHTKYLKTAGIGESTLSDQILGDLSEYLNDQVSLAFLPSFGQVTLRITGKGVSKEEAVSNTEALIALIREKAGKYIYGDDKEHSLSERVGEILMDQKKTISTAESCTGGLIASTITDIAGSSAYMLGGVVSYANEVKVQELGVSENDLEEDGAVSKKVALQMARGVAEKLGSDIGISTTGIAGPGGGTPEKPVGTVWIGFYSKEQHFAVKALLTKDRLVNKQRTTIMALEIIRRMLLGIDELPYALTKEMA
ncbi:MAG: competence/damage-inducible protein A [Balneolaceae bacterium]|nr:competence/damage-inducible protein A [Balneolaceae bacterium]